MSFKALNVKKPPNQKWVFEANAYSKWLTLYVTSDGAEKKAAGARPSVETQGRRVFPSVIKRLDCRAKMEHKNSLRFNPHLPSLLRSAFAGVYFTWLGIPLHHQPLKKKSCLAGVGQENTKCNPICSSEKKGKKENTGSDQKNESKTWCVLMYGNQLGEVENLWGHTPPCFWRRKNTARDRREVRTSETESSLPCTGRETEWNSVRFNIPPHGCICLCQRENLSRLLGWFNSPYLDVLIPLRKITGVCRYKHGTIIT